MVSAQQFGRRGFALILVLALLALAVLVTVTLSALGKINHEIARSSDHRTRARQNALVGIGVALGRLQRLAGADDAVTSMAGVAGAPNATEFRHWCGVWNASGVFQGWLTSGATSSTPPALATARTVTLVGARSVGPRPATASAYSDEEHVIAGLLDLVALDERGQTVTNGAFAYWVGDEGGKTSLHAPSGSLPAGGFAPLVASTPTNIARVGLAFKTVDAVRAAHVLAYSQARLLRYSATSFLGAANLQDAFHHVTLAHAWQDFAASRVVRGKLNLNTNSAVVWRGLLESYQAQPTWPDFGTAAKLTSAVNTIAGGIAASSAGKAPFAPYVSVDAFLSSALLDAAVGGTNGVPPATFAQAVRPMLTTRSDTFRIRAYGSAVDPLAPARRLAEAYCEALVQRTELVAADGAGHRFRIVSWRWLGPDDL